MERVVQGDEGFTARTSGRSPDRSPDGGRDDACPYQGLAPFEAENSELFFGRARATRDLLGRLGGRLGDDARPRGSILLVSGASGVGKSSLLRAGVLPALAAGMLPVDGSRHWLRLLMTPTATPLRTLAARWAAAYGGSGETAYEQLRRGQGTGPLAAGGRLVLIVDQFEELFTLVADERERQAFVRALHDLAAGPPAAAVIIGVRADYWDRCAAYPQFAEAIQDGQVIVEPMTESDLRLAITGPAATAGLEIEPGLVETVLGDLSAGRDAAGRYAAGALPLLSQALRNTWDRREDGRLTIRGYEESGRVRDAVQHTADEVFQRLSAEDRTTALRIFRRLTVIIAGGRVARRRATMSEIHAAASAHSADDSKRDRVDALVSAFAGRRLLTLHEDTAEIAHDALLTAWPTLRRWLDPDLTAQAVYDQLIEDAAQWDRNRRDPAFLYRGGRLLSVQDTRPRWDRDTDSFPPPGPVVAGFIAASTRAARRAERTRRLVMAGLAVLSVLALIAAGAAIEAANDADRQRNLAVSRLLAEQSEVAGDPVTAALLAAAAWRIAPTQEARYRMLDAAARTGRAVLSGHTAAVTALVFSRDGSTIATGSDDGTARLWDTAARRPRGAPIAHPRRECSGSGVDAVAVSPDGRVVATACLGNVRFWDAGTHRPLGGPVDNGSPVPAIAFSPDGRTLAAASLRGYVRLWDVATRNPRGAAIGRPSASAAGLDPVNAVAFSPDGKLVAAAGAGNTARLWDTATHRQVGDALTGHEEAIQDLSFSPDGRTLATASTDGTARVWDLATHRQTGAALQEPAGTRGFNGIAYSPDGRRLATAGADGRTQIWDAAGRRPVGSALADNRLPARRVAFSPDGRVIAVAGEDGMVRLGDPVTHQQIGAALPGLSAVAVSPDGRTLATAERDNTTRLWDVAAQRPIGDPLRPADDRTIDRQGALFGLEFSPDGRRLATAGLDGVRLFDTAGRRQLGPPVYAERPIGVVEFNPDGTGLAIARAEAIQFWRLAGRGGSPTGPLIRVPGHTDVLSTMAISADGATLATVGWDRTVRLFDTATGRQIGAPIPVAVTGVLDQLTFSPDGRTLAIAANNDTVRLWNIPTRRQVGALTGHTDWISAIAFSPDGKVVATGSADGTVRLWDLMTNRQIGIPLTGHTATVTGIAYTPDGTTVATVADDETVRLWNVAIPADPVATTCANAGRSFTRAEWERYIPGLRFREVCP
jgi:WD40 repeat protein